MKRCPRLYPLQLLSRKWSYLVLRALREPSSFSNLKQELHFITNRILSRELGILQKEALVKLEKREYRLTKAGVDIIAALEPLVAWSHKHKECSDCTDTCSQCPHYAEAVGFKRKS